MVPHSTEYRDVCACVCVCVCVRSEEHTSELQSHLNLVCRLLLEKKNESISLCSLRALYASRRARLLFFFNDTATTEIYTLSLHDALPIFYRDVCACVCVCVCV